VAHFCDCEPDRVDGVAASVGLTVELLRWAGHEVAHFHPGPLLGRRPRGVRRSVPLPLRALRVAWPWDRACDAGEVDVVHVHTTGPVGMAGFRLAADRGLPLVITWHTDLVAYGEHYPEVAVGAAYDAVSLGLGWTLRAHLELLDPLRRRDRLLRLGRGFAGRAAVFIAPSAKAAAGLAEFGDLPPVHIVPTPVIPAGADPAPGLPLGAPVVLSVGRFTAEKNPALLLHAFARVRARLRDAHLVLVGVRQGGRRIWALIRELDLNGWVHLVPPVPRDEVAGYYRTADVLAFASTTDTQGLVLAEAEAAGLPVVVADPALAARPGDPASLRTTCRSVPDEFAAALIRMLTDGELWECTRLAGLRAARAYPPERFLSLLTAAYSDAQRSRPAAIACAPLQPLT
jgi:glycosyltransferase involved in cell wall biosynthesis